MCMTILRFFSSKVSRRILQLALPDGGDEQHRAMIWASVSPSTIGSTGGFVLSFLSNAAASVSSKNFFQIRLTVLRSRLRP